MNEELSGQAALEHVLLDSTGPAIFSTTAEGVIISFSRGAEQLLGYAAAELVGRQTPGLWHDVAEVAARAEELTRELGRNIDPGFEVFVAKAQGRGETRKWTYVRKDGARVPVLSSFSALRNEKGAPSGFLGVAQDLTELIRLDTREAGDVHARADVKAALDEHAIVVITARKREEENLRRMATVVRDSNDAITIQDFEGRITAWNRGAELMYGYSEAEALAVNIERLTTPGKVAEQQDFIRRLIAGEAITSFETQRVTKDGRVLDVWMTVTKLMGEAGEPIGIASTERDITARKREEENLRRMATVVRDSNDAITIQDFEGRITAWNRGARLMYGYSEEEALQMNIGRLTSPGKVKEQEEFTRRLIAGETVTSFETQRVTKDGRVLDVWMTVTKLMGEAGEPIGIASTERDITERRQLEAQFLQAQKMESVGRLAGGVAHDFNNLLTVINSTAELAATQLRPSDPLQQDLAEIRGAGARAAVLTKQLLAFSRKQVLQPQAVNLTALVTDLQPLLRRLISEDIALPVGLAEDLANVRVDPGQIEQVIVNLAVNARDAMPNGGTLTIETRNVELDDAYSSMHPSVQPGPYVMLAISDTGVGMDRATLQRLFEPFFTTKTPGKGTGLGLATVYGIVTQSGGSIWVYSEVGKGTAFKIYLPRVAEAAREHRPTPTGVVARGTETILVVEDEESLRRVAQRVLASAGYTVLVAANGGEALWLLERRDPPVDLVLTDVVMPGMSGGTLADRIRGSQSKMKILFTSGYTDDAIGHHGVLDEGVHFIAKPYTIADLTRKVREVLDS
jgi:PAS domain S-box-containing protein